MPPDSAQYLSGAPGDSDSNSSPSGIPGETRLKFTGLSGVHRTVSGAPREVGLRNSPASGKRQRLVHYNSPDCPVCTGLSGAPPKQRSSPRQRLSAAHLMRPLRAQKSESPMLAHRTSNSTCPVCTGHPGGPTSQKLQRSESNGSDDVAGGTGLSGAPCHVITAVGF